MKVRLIVFFLGTLLFCCNSNKSIDPLDYMNRQEQVRVIQKFIRYSAKLAPNSSRETMFNSEFDWYYDKAALEYNFMHLKPDENGGYYFLASRPARSIRPMFEGIGGQLKLNEKDSLIEYNEIFRMWKMEDKDLAVRGKFLFQKLIKKEDLSPFYPNVTGDQYIEFPDARFHFDKEKRKWVDSALDSLFNVSPN